MQLYTKVDMVIAVKYRGLQSPPGIRDLLNQPHMVSKQMLDVSRRFCIRILRSARVYLF